MRLAPQIASALVIFLFLAFSAEASSGNPAPYTEEAYQKIEAAAKAHQYKHDSNASQEVNFREMVEWDRAVYSQAGYSYDDTIVQVINDMRHHPDRIPNVPYSIPSMVYVGLHIFMSECEYAHVDCLKFFSSDTAKSITWLIKNTEFKF